MQTQSFSNHVRVHPLYHYFAVPVSLAMVPAALANLFFNFGFMAIILAVAMVILHLAIFLARDYAKRNQDRIIRMELRLRYYLITNQQLEEIETQFSIGQLLAMRFASDEELVNILNDPETKAKTPEQIKSQIIQWKPDLMRV
jgi:uncharacterized membrane protein